MKPMPIVGFLIKRLFLASLIFIAFFLAGFYNFFNSTNDEDFLNWQKDGSIRGYFGAGEAGYLNRIENDQTLKNDIKFGCLLTNIESPPGSVRLNLNKSQVIDSGITYEPYTSSICGYAFLVSYLYRMTPVDSINKIYLFQIFLFSIMITFILNFFARNIGKLYAVIYFISILFSPWITSAIKNLYWSPWIWYLPACAAIVYGSSKSRANRVASLIIVYITFVFKFWATGFEMFTSLIIFAAIMPTLVNLNNEKINSKFLLVYKESIHISLVGILSFLTVLILQVNLLPGNLISGFKYLFRESILRRTYGSAENYEIDYKDSLDANIFQVLQKYIFEWPKPILEFNFGDSGLRLGGQMLLPIIIIALIILLRHKIKNDKKLIHLCVLFVTGFFVTVSWLISAKGHSYIHTHILFVLWYLLFIPTSLYVIINFIINSMREKKSN
jgi:hypothetical protein